MDDYKLFIDWDVHERLKAMRGKRKKEIIQFLRAVRSDPFIKGEFQKLKDGLTLEIKVFGKYSIYFWPDHPVKEVKVVELLKSDE